MTMMMSMMSQKFTPQERSIQLTTWESGEQIAMLRKYTLFGGCTGAGITVYWGSSDSLHVVKRR